MAEERMQRYYVTRINKENGEIGYITIERFDELPRARASIDDVNGYDDASTARAIATRLNQVSDLIDGKFEHYETRRDENTFPNLNGLSEAAKKWFSDKSDQTDDPVEA